jgi:hypothetical protein
MQLYLSRLKFEKSLFHSTGSPPVGSDRTTRPPATELHRSVSRAKRLWVLQSGKCLRRRAVESALIRPLALRVDPTMAHDASAGRGCTSVAFSIAQGPCDRAPLIFCLALGALLVGRRRHRNHPNPRWRWSSRAAGTWPARTEGPFVAHKAAAPPPCSFEGGRKRGPSGVTRSFTAKPGDFARRARERRTSEAIGRHWKNAALPSRGNE